MTADTGALEEKAHAFADRFVQRAAGELESIVFSPFPFTGGQLLIVCKERVRHLHEVMASAHLCDPPDIPTHWLRLSELGSLSIPYTSVFFWRKLTGGYPGWPYWLRNRGQVLWGADVRAGIPLPEDPRRILEAAIGGSLTYNRHMLFLNMLMRERYAELVEALAGLVRLLMATALLLHGEWQIEEATVSYRFLEVYGAESVGDLCSRASEVFAGPSDGDEPSRRAYEAVWIVESLMRRLRRYVE